MTAARRKTAKRKTSPRDTLTIVIEEESWRDNPATLKLIGRAARLALAARQKGLSGIRTKPAAVTILLSNDSALKRLNRAFRQKNKPTNVLAFPSADPVYLGDVAIARETVRREAKAQSKTVAAHAAHLAIHGVLHLLGYDHGDERDAETMEALETQLLARLKLADPYA